MGRRKRHVKAMGSWQPYSRSEALPVAVPSEKMAEAAESEQTHGSAPALSGPTATATGAPADEAPVTCEVVENGVSISVQSPDTVQSVAGDVPSQPSGARDLYAMSGEELWAEWCRIERRRQEPAARQQALKVRLRGDKLTQYLAASNQELQREQNTWLLEAAGALHGRGLIRKLEERWTRLSKHPNISHMKRWERWAVLRDEHADELRAVAVDGVQLISQEILDNLVAILQDLNDKCRHNQGPLALGMRLWIEADLLCQHGGRVLMALCKCYGISFICYQNGYIRTSQEELIKRKAALDEFNQTFSSTYQVSSDV